MTSKTKRRTYIVTGAVAGRVKFKCKAIDEDEALDKFFRAWGDEKINPEPDSFRIDAYSVE